MRVDMPGATGPNQENVSHTGSTPRANVAVAIVVVDMRMSLGATGMPGGWHGSGRTDPSDAFPTRLLKRVEDVPLGIRHPDY